MSTAKKPTTQETIALGPVQPVPPVGVLKTSGPVPLGNVKFIEDINYSGRMSRAWMPFVGQGYTVEAVQTEFGPHVHIACAGYPPLYVPWDKVLQFHVAPEAK